MGHTPLQVLMGTLPGLGVGLLVENGRYFQYYESLRIKSQAPKWT